MNLKIRKLKENEIEELAEVMNKADNRTLEWARDRINTFDGIRKVLLVAEIRGKIVGYVGLKIKEKEDRASEFINLNNLACLLWIAVLPEYHGKGIGSRLIKACNKYAKKWNKSGIWLDCYESKIPFYEKAGYVIKGKYLDNNKLRVVFQNNLK